MILISSGWCDREILGQPGLIDGFIQGVRTADAPRNTTVLEKNIIQEEVSEGAERRDETVAKGDTLTAILLRVGAEQWQAKEIIAAMNPA